MTGAAPPRSGARTALAALRALFVGACVRRQARRFAVRPWIATCRLILLSFVALPPAGAADARERIVSLAPALTESLFDIGAGDTVVGTMAFSDRPEAARAIARIGGHSGLDLERIITLQPTLALAWGGGTPARWVERLRALGLRVETVTVNTLDGIADSLQRLGQLSGHEPGGARAAARVRERLALIGSRPATLRAFYQVWPEPLMTLNGRHVISDAMRRCGAANVFADLDSLVPVIGVEDVLRAAPEAIIAARAPGDEADPLLRWRAFGSLPAVHHNRLILLNADRIARPTAAMLDEVAILCEALRR